MNYEGCIDWVKGDKKMAQVMPITSEKEGV